MEMTAKTSVSGRVVINLVNDQGLRVSALSSLTMRRMMVALKPGETATVECQIPSLNLMPRTYSLILGYYNFSSVIDEVEQAVSFEVIPADVYGTGQIPLGITEVFYHGQWSRMRVAPTPPGMQQREAGDVR
jgi:hypothetical protein